MRRGLMIAAAAAALGTSASPALAAITVSGTGSSTAATITSDTATGDSFTINFDGEVNGVVNPALASSVQLIFEGITGGNTYNFDYVVTNNSSMASRVSVFGFNSDPNITSAASTGIFPTISSGSLASFNLEVCLDSGNANNCNSSTAGVGVVNGTVSGGAGNTLALTYATPLPGSITLSNFLDRYQGVGGSGGTSAEGHPVAAVPEPGTWAMMLIGFGAVGFSMRRRRRPALAQIA